jgi:hypothetical protein
VQESWQAGLPKGWFRLQTEHADDSAPCGGESKEINRYVEWKCDSPSYVRISLQPCLWPRLPLYPLYLESEPLATLGQTTVAMAKGRGSKVGLPWEVGAWKMGDVE